MTIALTGVQPDIMGYYACTFVHTSTATTPVFALTPSVLINGTLGITTPCPVNNFFPFTEIMSDGKKCCGHAAYIGVAAALFTSICICIVGASAFAISEVLHSLNTEKRHRT